MDENWEIQNMNLSGDPKEGGVVLTWKYLLVHPSFVHWMSNSPDLLGKNLSSWVHVGMEVNPCHFLYDVSPPILLGQVAGVIEQDPMGLKYWYLSTNLRGVTSQKNPKSYLCFNLANGHVCVWGRGARGTMLQVIRSRVQFLMRSLDFSVDLILPAALWPWGQLSL
jgi:hypothetical protein